MVYDTDVVSANLLKFVYIYYLYACVWALTSHGVSVGVRVWESVPSLPSVGFRDPTQVIGLVEKHCYLLSHLTRSSLESLGLRKQGALPI